MQRAAAIERATQPFTVRRAVDTLPARVSYQPLTTQTARPPTPQRPGNPDRQYLMNTWPFSFMRSEPEAGEAPNAVASRILRDGLLLARWYILCRLAEEMERARRYRRPLCAVLASPAVLPGEHLDERALASGAAAARLVARSTDIAGWLEDGSILIVMPEITHAQARVAVFRWRNEIMVRTARKWWFAVIEDAGKYENTEQLLQAATEQVARRDAA